MFISGIALEDFSILKLLTRYKEWIRRRWWLFWKITEKGGRPNHCQALLAGRLSLKGNLGNQFFQVAAITMDPFSLHVQERKLEANFLEDVRAAKKCPYGRQTFKKHNLKRSWLFLSLSLHDTHTHIYTHTHTYKHMRMHSRTFALTRTHTLTCTYTRNYYRDTFSPSASYCRLFLSAHHNFDSSSFSSSSFAFS